MNLNNVIGDNLKRLRNERNLSLSKLSEICGVSKVMLSQIERGESSPTINTIWKIAKGFNLPYTVLIDKPLDSHLLVRKNEASIQTSADSHYRVYCYYTNNEKRNFELFIVELDGNSSYTSNSHGEKTQEYILINEGSLNLNVDGNSYILNKGDSIVFDSSKVHSYSNLNDNQLNMTIINYYLL